VGVSVIRVLVLIVFFIVCTVFLYCFLCIFILNTMMIGKQCQELTPHVKQRSVAEQNKNTKTESSFFWDVTRRILVIGYRRFGTKYGSYFRGPLSVLEPNDY